MGEEMKWDDRDAIDLTWLFYVLLIIGILIACKVLLSYMTIEQFIPRAK